MIKLLVVDDHPIFRKGLVALIADKCPDFTIVEANDGSGAIEELNKGHFDVTILDIDMPHKSGIDVLDFIKNNGIKTKSVILTMHNDELFFNEAFNRGAMGFVLKEDSGLEIIDCIENENFAGVCEDIGSWIFDENYQIIGGLLDRRKEEVKIFLTQIMITRFCSSFAWQMRYFSRRGRC